MKKILLAVTLLAGCTSSLPDMTREEVETLGVGLHERYHRRDLQAMIGVDPSRTAWCAAYVDYVLDVVFDLEGTDSLLAKSYLNWGISVREPDLWDVVVFERNGPGWEGHVGFYMGETVIDGRTYYWILGGNQNDAVTVELYPRSEVLGIRRSRYEDII